MVGWYAKSEFGGVRLHLEVGTMVLRALCRGLGVVDDCVWVVMMVVSAFV